MKEQDPKKEMESLFHIDSQVENGAYANAANIIHSSNEFLVDFVLVLPGGKKKVVARVITSPAHAKQLAEALRGNVAKYEAAYGEIKLPSPGGAAPVFPAIQ